MAPGNDPTRVLILGAAGRDFHNFNCCYREDPGCRVVAFTATQIPNIDGRAYPPELAGPLYPQGIPIHPEIELEALIRDLRIDLAVFSYSDVPHAYVMHMASRVSAAGADFGLIGAARTMFPSRRPVVAVCAVRTGCGKSQTTRLVAGALRAMGKRIAVIRHPMPYGDLRRQACQRFATLADMDQHECTIEEREEYELHIANGNLLFAGVDYQRILAAAEAEADVILWDGGNNDTPFYKPDLWITVADPHRPGHELAYYPGETNFRMADVILINKVNTARPEDVATIESNAAAVNPRARVIRADSDILCDARDQIHGKRVLVVEDGPTLTHGEMRIGAAHVAARKFGATRIVDPRPHAAGSIRDVFQKYGHLTDILPAMGYGRSQIADLEATINATPCDLVLIGTPIDLALLIKINKPAVRVAYELAGAGAATLTELVRAHPRLL
ncbi:MAG: GTPase [Planctomycetota bacterium]|nr:MAG: GTPase [Planctomycetota bacterium]